MARGDRADLVLFRKALKERWPISDRMRQIVLERLGEVLEKSPNYRDWIAAARTLGLLDGINQVNERLVIDQLMAMHTIEMEKATGEVPGPIREGGAATASEDALA